MIVWCFSTAVFRVSQEVRPLAPSTKLALANSLKKLLQKKFLDDITVKELVEDCDVNRQTFYYHFQDIYDLLRWFLAHETEQTLQGAHDWHEELMRAFCYLQENHLAIYHVFRSSGRDHLDCQFFSLSQALVSKLFGLYAGDLTLPEEDRAFLTDFYMYALSGILVRWISDDMKEDPEILVDRLTRLLEPEIRRAAERFANPPTGSTPS